MAKPLEKSKARKTQEKQDKQRELVKAALRMGLTTKKDICTSSDMALWELNELFQADKDLYNDFCVRRRTLSDVAADNLETILRDPVHPQNFQATKYVLEKYKTDIDTQLESKDAEEVDIEVLGSGSIPVRITFGTKKSNDE